MAAGPQSPDRPNELVGAEGHTPLVRVRATECLEHRPESSELVVLLTEQVVGDLRCLSRSETVLRGVVASQRHNPR